MLLYRKEKKKEEKKWAGAGGGGLQKKLGNNNNVPSDQKYVEVVSACCSAVERVANSISNSVCDDLDANGLNVAWSIEISIMSFATTSVHAGVLH